MQLMDLENECLIYLQQPGANPGGAPTWSSLTNPQFNQAVIDWSINRGYERLMGDVAEMEIVANSFTVSSTTGTFYYTATPPAGQPNACRYNRIFYAPVGLNYTYEYRPGFLFIDWTEFQKLTDWGYLLQTGASTSTLPTYWSLYPDRTKLACYPGTANAGDQITFMYAPLPTPGASFCPTLVNPTDTPVLPADCHEAIAQWALNVLWTKQREAQMALSAKARYQEELERIKTIYTAAHKGAAKKLFQLDEFDSGQIPGSFIFP